LGQNAPPDGRAAKYPRDVASFLFIHAKPIILFHWLGVVEYLLSTKHLIIDFKNRFQEPRRLGDNPPSGQFNPNPSAGVVSGITMHRVGGEPSL
jgi:hypothetical protein